MWQGWEGNEMYFFYDNTGAPIAFWYFPKGGARVTGYYFTNAQGDVTRIEDPNGNVLATYAYDAWGRNYSASGSMQNINPLRYRGYYQDAETNFYYLQSRYYDPSIARFINADSYASTGQGFLGYNMFAYCGNDPVNHADVSGNRYTMINDYGGGGKKELSISEKIGQSTWSFISSITVDAGLGVGFGLKGKAGPFDGSWILHLEDPIAFHYSYEDGINIGSYWEESGGISVPGASAGYSVSQFTPWMSWLGEADSSIQESAPSLLGISLGGYLILGGRFSIGWDTEKVIYDWIEIWS